MSRLFFSGSARKTYTCKAVRGEGGPFWLQPGEAGVTLGSGEEREVERIPEPLKRFL